MEWTEGGFLFCSKSRNCSIQDQVKNFLVENLVEGVGRNDPSILRKGGDGQHAGSGCRIQETDDVRR